jgi:hypothetical protein
MTFRTLVRPSACTDRATPVIERLPILRQCSAEHEAPGIANQPRLSLTWYLDPITGKPAARWVSKAPEVNPLRDDAATACAARHPRDTIEVSG